MTTPQADPNIGRRIKNYQILQKLGDGGIGQVYRAEQLPLGKAVALKLLKPQLSRNAELRARFLQEAQISAQINHENIVEIVDYGETMDGECFLVMELLLGAPLGTALQQNAGPMTAKRVGHIGVQLCAALYAAHQRGAVHRDLKPDNIFLIEHAGQKDFAKILDFGLAKVTQGDPQHALTTIGKVLGTPYFMSPEQTLGEVVDPRSDIYSLGVVLFQLATDTLPFTGKTVGEVMYKQVHQAVPAPKSRYAKIDPKLAAVLLTALQKQKEKRYPSMLAFAKDLGAACGIDYSYYFAEKSTITRKANEAPPPPEISSAPSWSMGTPLPEEIVAAKAAQKSAMSLASQSQMDTVHVRAPKKPGWLIPVAILIFFATIALLVFAAKLA